MGVAHGGSRQGERGWRVIDGAPLFLRAGDDPRENAGCACDVGREWAGEILPSAPSFFGGCARGPRTAPRPRPDGPIVGPFLIEDVLL